MGSEVGHLARQTLEVVTGQLTVVLLLAGIVASILRCASF